MTSYSFRVTDRQCPLSHVSSYAFAYAWASASILKNSVLYALRTLVHLGVQWDFETACVRPTDDKIAKVCELLTRVPNAQHSPSIVGVVVGYASFLREARTLGPSAFSVLQRTMLRELRQGRLFRWVTLSRFARHDLTWWRTALSSVRWVRVREPKPTLIVYTDASKLSLGYSYNVTNSGVWSVAEAAMHINVLETRVVRLTLEHAPQAFAGQSVCFYLDNVSAVYYLNKQGGTRSSTLMTEARTVLLLAERLDVHVTAVHVRLRTQCTGGRAVTQSVRHEDRLATVRRSVSVVMREQSVGDSDVRVVCEQVESPPSSLHVSLPGRSGVRIRRTGMSVAEQSFVRFSSVHAP